MAVLDRAQIRLKDDNPDVELLKELVTTAQDRISLRAGIVTDTPFPQALETIAVEVVVKAFRRQYHEGISSESTGISTSFVDDIIAEHDAEIDQWATTAEGSTRKRVVRFL